MNGAKAKKIASFVLLPQVIPRAKVLFASGFGYIAFLMASIYGAVRLLPAGHPYLDPANIGKFGIHHAIGEAANHLVFSRKNADQIFVFFALMTGMMALALQIGLVLYGFIVAPAFAGPALSYFVTPAPTTGKFSIDIAFTVLDQVFGVPNLFCAAGDVCTNVPTLTPFHQALHAMLRFYSMGLLIVGVVIFLYYVIVIVGETATTGHPFGQRFQNGWVPIRLVVALGLLVPINYGLNSGQYIVLYAAKFGSSFATNGWLQFNTTMKSTMGTTANNPTGERRSLLAKPNTPDVSGFVSTMSMVHACAYAHWKVDNLVTSGQPQPPSAGFYLKPYLIKHPQNWMANQAQNLELTNGLGYVAALDFFNNGDIIIRWGRLDNSAGNQEKGKVIPMCGDVRIPIGYLKTRGQGGTYGGPDMMQQFYFDMVKMMWFGGTLMEALPKRYMEVALNIDPDPCNIGSGYAVLPGPGDCDSSSDRALPSAEAKQALVNFYQVMAETFTTTAWDRYNTNATDIEMRQAVLDRGWAGAGIWYNTIAEINGAFITSVVNMPSFERHPQVMEQVREQRRKSDAQVEATKWCRPNIADGRAVTIGGSLDIAQKLCDFYTWWAKDDLNAAKADKTPTSSTLVDSITAIFGVSGLFALRGENAHIHPLAQLAAIGKSLVDSATTNVGMATLGSGIGGLVKILDSQLLGPGVDIASNLMMTVAFLFLTAGFVLYYVLPFLPFVYFFFAFGTWVKSIFEAMVGTPLWALAHLRIDGEGLPGDSASSGYFLIFEIFVRPILTVFGLVAAVLILTAQVRMLNVLWDLVTSNLTGFQGYVPQGGGIQKKIPYGGYQVLPRNRIDEFFFTIVYAIIVYMMATASFKMIDKIPDQLLRFMGAGVSAFSDINPDPTEGLTRYAALGGITVGQQAAGAMRGLTKGMGDSLAGEVQKVASAIRTGGGGP